MKTNLTSEMKSILTDYTDEMVDIVLSEIEKVGKEAAQDLHSAGSFKSRTGAYRRGWTSEVEKKRTYSSVVVHNKKRYQLTHLLEYGHAKRNGGRTRAFAHIEAVNEKAQENAIRQITQAIKRA